MKWGVDLLAIFQVCFYLGLGLILVSFLLGSVFNVLDLDGFDLDFEILGIDFYFPISPMLMTVFLTVFGGVGWILMDRIPSIFTIVIVSIALSAGISIYLLLFHLVIKPLKKAENTSAPDADDLIGLPAKVTETIYQDGFGEISYIINGNSYTAPAKTTTGVEMKRGAEVAICWITDYVFYVIGVDIVDQEKN